MGRVFSAFRKNQQSFMEAHPHYILLRALEVVCLVLLNRKSRWPLVPLLGEKACHCQLSFVSLLNIRVDATCPEIQLKLK